MKQITLISLLILTISNCIAQQKYIQLVNNETGKTKLFKENKRVKVKTLDNNKFIGRFSFVNDSTISIKGQEIKLENIERIKRRSVVFGVLGTIIIIYGTMIIGASPLIAAFSGASDGILVFSLGAIVLNSGIFMNEFVPTHKSNKWSYKLISR